MTLRDEDRQVDLQSRKIDRNKICRIRRYIRTYNARLRQRGQHGGPITHTHCQIFDAIVQFINWSNGLCFPSIKTISERAGCAESTVQAALKTLQAAGVLARIRRTKWVVRRAHGRTYRVPVRTSNRYIFLLPTAVQAAAIAPSARAHTPDRGPQLPRDLAGLTIFAAMTRQAPPGPTLGRGCESRLAPVIAAYRARRGIKPLHG